MSCISRSLVLGLALACAGLAPAAAETRNYPPSSADFRNPERGFWRFVAEDFAKVTKGELADVAKSGMTMAYGVVRLDDFRSRPLSPKLLGQLEEAFERTRKSGVKIILRFAYNYPANEFEYKNAKDAPLDVVLGHIEQLKPVIAANADVVAVLQAGFIGAWGEGHTSSNKLTKAGPKAKIRDALLSILPNDRMLQWRYPADVIDWYAKPPKKGALGRIGLHNDCFMSSKTDVGTYASKPELREKQKDYAARLSRATLYGGETCDVDSGTERMSCAAILSEGPRFHLTTLHRDYNRKFIERWRDDGCFNEVSRSMGYRLALTRAEAPDAARRGVTERVVVSIRNEGWARLYNPRPLRLGLTHRATGRRFVVTAPGDVRSVEPESAGAAAFAFEWTAPADAPTGRYDLDLALPDAGTRLADDPRYAVRFANGSGEGFGWDGETGRYALGLSITLAAD